MNPHKFRVEWPEKDGEYKVIQILYNETEPLLRFGDRRETGAQGSFHAEIVEFFAEEIDVACEKIKGLKSGPPIPKLPDNIPYKTVGMGRAYVGLESASFFGESRDYGLKINVDHLRLMKNFSTKRLFIPV